MKYENQIYLAILRFELELSIENEIAYLPQEKKSN